MTVLCSSPDATLGVAYRISVYLDCQARALGENGFQALAGGPLGSALLFGLLTIFIALIGYRLILGHVPDMRDGVGWAVRLGFVLALVTSWPAFQALVYRVAVDAPGEIAAVVMPAAGLPSESLDARVQQAYDQMRLGVADAQADPAADEEEETEGTIGAAPQTATLLVISTSGLTGALRIAIGFLLAVAPLAIMSLLFSGTSGLFNGWLRALAGLALGSIGVTIVTAIDLLMVESELAHLQAFGFAGMPEGVDPQDLTAIDPQALTTIVALFALVAIVTTVAGVRMGSALKLPADRSPPPQLVTVSAPGTRVDARSVLISDNLDRRPPDAATQGRASAVAGALKATVRREERFRSPANDAQNQYPRQVAMAEAVVQTAEGPMSPSTGPAGRRGLGRQTRSAARRDKWREA